MSFNMYWNDRHVVGTADQLFELIDANGGSGPCYVGLSHWGYCSLTGPCYEEDEG